MSADFQPNKAAPMSSAAVAAEGDIFTTDGSKPHSTPKALDKAGIAKACLCLSHTAYCLLFALSSLNLTPCFVHHARMPLSCPCQLVMGRHAPHLQVDCTRNSHLSIALQPTSAFCCQVTVPSTCCILPSRLHR